MSRMSQIATRQCEPEWMDQPAVTDGRLFDALRGLERINRVSLSAGIVWGPIRDLAVAHDRATLKVLDVACGGGDVPIALWHRARAVGLELEIHGCDRNPQMVEYATEQARLRTADVSFHVRDVVQDGLPGDHDVITSSLFFHHLTDADARKLLRHMADTAHQMVIVNDLHRCAPGLALAYLACFSLSSSDMVRYDGPRSAAAAFTATEMRAMAESIGLMDVKVTRHWPFRFRLVWHRP